jgi:hypothetical protein
MGPSPLRPAAISRAVARQALATCSAALTSRPPGDTAAGSIEPADVPPPVDEDDTPAAGEDDDVPRRDDGAPAAVDAGPRPEASGGPDVVPGAGAGLAGPAGVGDGPDGPAGDGSDGAGAGIVGAGGAGCGASRAGAGGSGGGAGSGGSGRSGGGTSGNSGTGTGSGGSGGRGRLGAERALAATHTATAAATASTADRLARSHASSLPVDVRSDAEYLRVVGTGPLVGGPEIIRPGGVCRRVTFRYTAHPKQGTATLRWACRRAGADHSAPLHLDVLAPPRDTVVSVYSILRQPCSPVPAPPARTGAVADVC